jgi:glycosyltransferase involved in cell wall biosynthesis
MKIDIYTVTWNEEILLPYFIQFYKNRFPTSEVNIIIYDNESTDNTIQIAKEAGCKIFTYSTNNTYNEIEHIRIKNNCWKESTADWIFIVDCDEFVNINENELENITEKGYTLVNTVGYNMINTILDIPNTILGTRSIWYDKMSLFMPKYISEINYNPGCHSCTPSGEKISIYANQIKLLHYKRLSLEYYLNRIQLSRNRLSDINKHYRLGTHFQASDEEHIEDFNKILSEAKPVLNNAQTV